MPHVDIKMFSGRDDETKKKVAEAVLDTMAETLGCPKAHLSVAIDDVDPSVWNEEVHDKVDPSTVYAGSVFENK